MATDEESTAGSRRLTSEQRAALKDAIIKEAKEGVPSSVIMEKYGISPPTYFDWTRHLRGKS